jgi:hypothetical protein
MSDISGAAFQSSRPAVFICSSPDDKKYSQELRKYLHDMHKSHLGVWDTSSVSPGSMWQEEMEQALQSSRVAVLLTSVDFFYDDFIVEHIVPRLVTAAKQKSITIINVILHRYEFEATELAKFQPVNSPSRPLGAMKQSEQAKIWVEVCSWA